MRTVRAKNPQTGEETVLEAAEYDAQRHGHLDLCCADPECGAPMRFKSGYWRNGAIEFIEPHFASESKDDHAEFCTAYDQDIKWTSERTSIIKAIKDDAYILINYNSPNTGYREARSKETSRLIAWDKAQRNVHSRATTKKHAVVGIKNAQELMNCLSYIGTKGGAKALRSVHIKHGHDVAPLRDVILPAGGLEQKDFKTRLHENLEKYGTQRLAVFPRLLLFEPSYQSAVKGIGDNRLASSFDPVAGHNHVLRITAQNIDDADIVSLGGKVAVFAIPELRAGGTQIGWNILDRDMVARTSKKQQDLFNWPLRSVQG